jgi:hypothetical protein
MQNTGACFRTTHLHVSRPLPSRYQRCLKTLSSTALPARAAVSRDVFKRFARRIPASPIRIDRKGEIFRELHVSVSGNAW